MGESHVTIEVAVLPVSASQEMLGLAGSCQYWERGWGQILAQSLKKRTACHH